MQQPHENTSIIDEIIDLEWNMFAAVQSIDGQTKCQRQPETFNLQRRSQYLTWPDVLLCCYRDDLRVARDEGRNLMTEKYARMMERTDPENFATLAGLLPPVDEEAFALAGEAADLLTRWEAETRKRFPFIVSYGRDLSQDAISQQGTSFETYLQAELLTYSPRTLRLYVRHLQRLADEQKNASELVYTELVKLYGYGSLAQANAAMAD